MKRFFAFGCSFTAYGWPTWADILGKEFDYYENWGCPGAGNFYIFNSVVECLIKNNLGPTDTVIVMWTNIYRNDTYHNNQWQGGGNSYHSRLPDKGKYYDDKGYLIRDLSVIQATKWVLERHRITPYFLSMVPIENPDQHSRTSIEGHDIASVLDLYQDTLKSIRPSIFEQVFDYDWNNRILLPVDIADKNPRDRDGHIRRRIDLHAGPAEHLAYLDAVLPEIAVSEQTRMLVKLANDQVIQPCNGQYPFESNYLPWEQQGWQPNWDLSNTRPNRL